MIATEAWLPSPAEVPRPPVETVSSWLSEPFAARANETTALPAAAFVWT